MQKLYRAEFTGETREQIYSRPLTHAYKVTYTRNGASAVKQGFAGSREKAEKAVKLAKACKVEAVEIVETTIHDAPAKANAAKPKKVKPFAKGDEVEAYIMTYERGQIALPAIVKGMRGDTVTLTVPGILNDIRVKLADVRKRYPDPTPLAQAA